MSSLPPLFDRLPEAFASSYDAARPWDLLGSPLDKALADLPSEHLETRPTPDVHLIGDRIWIGAGCRGSG